MLEANFNVPTFKTIDVCATLTGLSKYRVRQFVLQNKVKFIKAGQKYLISLTSLAEYLNNGDTTREEENK